MSYLVHVWFDAAYKKGVGGTECGHQGMQGVLKRIQTIRIRKADKPALQTFPIRLFTRALLNLCVCRVFIQDSL